MSDVKDIASATLEWAKQNRPDLVPEILRAIMAGGESVRPGAPPALALVPAPPPGRITVRELWTRWWQEEGRHKKSSADDKSRSKVILRYFADTYADEVTIKAFEAYRDKRAKEKTRYGDPPMPATLNREAALLRRMLNWAVHQDPKLAERNGLDGLKLLSEDNIKETRLDEFKIQQLVNAMEEMARLTAEREGGGASHAWKVVRAVTLALVDSGMREMEAIGLKWHHFDPHTGRCGLLRNRTKSKTPRVPRLSKRALLAIHELPRICEFVFANPKTKHHYHESYLHRLFVEGVARASLEGHNGESITFHTLRHTFSYRARVEWKWAVRTIMAVMGHTTQSAAERYGIVDDEECDAAHDDRDAYLARFDRIPARRAESPTGAPTEPQKKQA